jgi:hypothetical protein
MNVRAKSNPRDVAFGSETQPSQPARRQRSARGELAQRVEERREIARLPSFVTTKLQCAP